MLSLLGAAMLAATTGAAVGLLAALVPARPKPRPAVSIAIGVAGAVLAGFALPQLGAPVSQSLSMGMATSALGAAVPLAAVLVLKRANALSGTRLPLFHLAWHVAGALFLANAALVLASMPLAKHMRISEQTMIVSVVVAVALLAAGLLALRIAGKVLDICRLQPPETMAPMLADAMRGLLTSLILAGIALDAMLGLVAVGLLARIGQGFAIFG